MSESEPQVPITPWFAGRDVPLLLYRVNRRPLAQLKLFSQQPAKFLDHLVECLLFGAEVATAGRGSTRYWRLGNRHISIEEGYLAGLIGYRSGDTEAQDEYDEDNAEWKHTVVPTERRVTAPFVVVAATRLLVVAKHPTFGETTLPYVFEYLLQQGERARSEQTTEWAVEAVLDSKDFDRWVQETAVVSSVAFDVRMPNPDSSELFDQLVQHMNTAEANLHHSLKARDPERGLNKNFEQDSLSQALLDMAKRSFAIIRASGRNAQGRTRTYSQRERVRRQTALMPRGYDEAEATVVREALSMRINPEEEEAQ